ncbi:hypothetical protein Hanom_Chr01g00015071 [Helianthus anomalus]
MASQGKSTSSAMPTVTSSQTNVSLPPIPPPFQKNVENAQKKMSSVFQGSKTSITLSSTNTNQRYMEQQDKTNQRILREIDDIKKQKRPEEDQSQLVPRVLDFAIPATTTQQPRRYTIYQQGSLAMTQSQGSFIHQ